MSKIIEITNQIISIGTDDGGIKEVRADDINFVPHIGDEVEIFETETRIIVSKVEKKMHSLAFLLVVLTSIYKIYRDHKIQLTPNLQILSVVRSLTRLHIVSLLFSLGRSGYILFIRVIQELEYYVFYFPGQAFRHLPE